MIHDEICTYEVCKLAKEKGFNEYVNAFYAEGCDTPHSQGPEHWNDFDNKYSAPTQSLLQQWLRSNKQWSISVFWDMLTKDYRYEVVKTIGALEIKDDEEYYYSCLTDFDTYELALEDALKYTFKNLI